jgi:hypothetical protein
MRHAGAIELRKVAIRIQQLSIVGELRDVLYASSLVGWQGQVGAYAVRLELRQGRGSFKYAA